MDIYYCNECDNLILVSDEYKIVNKFMHEDGDVVRICKNCEQEGC